MSHPISKQEDEAEELPSRCSWSESALGTATTAKRPASYGQSRRKNGQSRRK
jgi:hypothetical protein